MNTTLNVLSDSPCFCIIAAVFIILWIWLFIEAIFAPDWTHLGELNFPVLDNQDIESRSEELLCSACGRAL